MKLLTFRVAGGLRLGVRTDRGVIDLTALAAALDLPNLPESVEGFLAGGAGTHRQVAAALEAAAAHMGGSPGWLLREEGLDLAPCLPNPGKIICVGLNYRRHAEEAGMKVPTSPVLFSKFNNALAGAGDSVAVAPGSTQMDYEAELAMVIGRRCRSVGQAEALDYVGGYCSANDISARDLQFLTGQWLLGKTPDGFCPVGPYLVTADEVPNPGKLGVRCHVNGELRQNSNTQDLIFPCDYLISYISRYITLEPGDLILTGTPEGVAMGRAEKPWLVPGDVVTVEIEGLGALTTPIRD